MSGMSGVMIALMVPKKIKTKMDELVDRGYHATISELVRVAVVRYLREIEKEDRKLEVLQ